MATGYRLIFSGPTASCTPAFGLWPCGTGGGLERKTRWPSSFLEGHGSTAGVRGFFFFFFLVFQHHEFTFRETAIAVYEQTFNAPGFLFSIATCINNRQTASALL